MDKLRKICALIVHTRPSTTNLELQKYLYFIQAATLLKYPHEAFNDEIEAWQFGPVVPRAYREFKYDKNLIELTQYDDLSVELKNLVGEILEDFKNDEAFELVDRTHSYSSWINAWNSSNSAIMTKESILGCHKKIELDNNGLIF